MGLNKKIQILDNEHDFLWKFAKVQYCKPKELHVWFEWYNDKRNTSFSNFCFFKPHLLDSMITFILVSMQYEGTNQYSSQSP